MCALTKTPSGKLADDKSVVINSSVHYAKKNLIIDQGNGHLIGCNQLGGSSSIGRALAILAELRSTHLCHFFFKGTHVIT